MAVQNPLLLFGDMGINWKVTHELHDEVLRYLERCGRTDKLGTIRTESDIFHVKDRIEQCRRFQQHGRGETS